MTTAYVPPAGPYEVLFDSAVPAKFPAKAPVAEGSTFSLFSSVQFIAEGPAIMPTFGGGGGGGTQGYIFCG